MITNRELLELELKQRNACFICHGELEEYDTCPVCGDPETCCTRDEINQELAKPYVDDECPLW